MSGNNITVLKLIATAFLNIITLEVNWVLRVSGISNEYLEGFDQNPSSIGVYPC